MRTSGCAQACRSIPRYKLPRIASISGAPNLAFWAAVQPRLPSLSTLSTSQGGTGTILPGIGVRLQSITSTGKKIVLSKSRLVRAGQRRGDCVGMHTKHGLNCLVPESGRGCKSVATAEASKCTARVLNIKLHQATRKLCSSAATHVNS